MGIVLVLAEIYTVIMVFVVLSWLYEGLFKIRLVFKVLLCLVGMLSAAFLS